MYMDFDIPPHNNREVSLYFLQKIYAEFVMGKHVNYFDMLGFQGAVQGMPQTRPNARNRDANIQIPPPRAQLPRSNIPPTHDMVTQTHEASLMLSEMISWHTTTIDQTRTSSTGGVQPPASSGIGPSIGGDRLTSHVPQSDPHVCTMCGQSYYGRGPTHGTSMMTSGQVRTL